MTIISSLVVICIYYSPQPLQFPEKVLVRVRKSRGSRAVEEARREVLLSVVIKAARCWSVKARVSPVPGQPRTVLAPHGGARLPEERGCRDAVPLPEEPLPRGAAAPGTSALGTAASGTAAPGTALQALLSFHGLPTAPARCHRQLAKRVRIVLLSHLYTLRLQNQ